MSLLQEIRRRNVHRVALAYLAGAWLLIQIAETLFPVFDLPNAAIRALVIILSIGFLPALIVSWIFEWTPQGLRREGEIEVSIGSRDTRAFDRLIMLTLIVALGYFAVDKFMLDPARDRAREREIAEVARSEAIRDSYGEQSIAVLAFEDLSPERSEEHFALGISEELLNLLARIPELRVAGRTSAFSFRDKEVTIPEIGEALDVAHVLEGSVRRAGERIRITAQLIEARSDTHLWSETYDRDFGDVFAIQDEIAATIVETLHVELIGGLPTQKPVDPQAYALYLQARTLFNGNLSAEDEERIPELLEQAVAIDPDYADAVALLSRYRWILGEPGKTPQETYQSVRKTINRLLSVEPNNAPALNWAGFMALALDNDLETAARYKERAHEADPQNYEVLWGASRVLPLYGRTDLAARIGRYVLKRDPLCFSCREGLARAYQYLDEYDAAQSVLEEGFALDPEWIVGFIVMTENHVLRGAPERALALVDGFSSSALGDGDHNLYLFPGPFMALHDAGRTAEFEAMLPEFIEIHARDYPLINAEVFAWIGDKDEAFRWLDEHERDMTWGIRLHLVRPWYRSLHDDPRWQDLLEQYGMTSSALEALNLDLRLPPGAD